MNSLHCDYRLTWGFIWTRYNQIINVVSSVTEFISIIENDYVLDETEKGIITENFIWYCK
jgi:hypothetical protein